MSAVPTLHIRNVPERLYEHLVERAKNENRSLNAEVLRILADWLESERQGEETIRRLDELRREYLLPDDAPTPEQLIREDRDAGH